MPSEKITSPTGLCRVLIVVLGVVIVELGIFSHFNSAWIRWEMYSKDNGHILPYKICELEPPTDSWYCPDIRMEQYFLGAVITTFLISICGLITCLVADMSYGAVRYVDLGFHLISAFLLLIAGVLCIISGANIMEAVKWVDKSIAEKWDFKIPQKIAAGALTIVQAMLYGCNAIFICKR